MSISVRALGKRFGPVTAVRDLTFDVPAGLVTGFLGPNGAGKSTTLRMMLGLVRPTTGEALIAGRRYADLPEPRRVVGAVLETTGFHPGRTGRDHLRIAARGAGVPAGRVDEVLERVGLAGAASGRSGAEPAVKRSRLAAGTAGAASGRSGAEPAVKRSRLAAGTAGAADRRVRGYSLGMRQRLGLAAALLGDPRVLILDEPGNGLDPAGLAWLRGLLRDLAAEGRTVIFSSHVLSEVAQTVDHLVIVNAGALGYAGPLERLAGPGDSLEAAFLRLTGDPSTAASLA
jgi:ABC-2 type transport system ATP-binding protein